MAGGCKSSEREGPYMRRLRSAGSGPRRLLRNRTAQSRTRQPTIRFQLHLSSPESRRQLVEVRRISKADGSCPSCGRHVARSISGVWQSAITQSPLGDEEVRVRISRSKRTRTNMDRRGRTGGVHPLATSKALYEGAAFRAIHPKLRDGSGELASLHEGAMERRRPPRRPRRRQPRCAHLRPDHRPLLESRPADHPADRELDQPARICAQRSDQPQ